MIDTHIVRYPNQTAILVTPQLQPTIRFFPQHLYFSERYSQNFVLIIIQVKTTL